MELFVLLIIFVVAGKIKEVNIMAIYFVELIYFDEYSSWIIALILEFKITILIHKYQQYPRLQMTLVSSEFSNIKYYHFFINFFYGNLFHWSFFDEALSLFSSSAV